jgi:lysophospholipase L1-like esterase
VREKPLERLGHLLAAVAGTALALAAVEVGLRLFAPQPLATSHLTPLGLVLHVPGARIRYARTEFDRTIVTNSLGLRDREVSLEKPPGTVRILLLGDSYAEGKQVELEETFSERLEALLNARRPQHRWEVVNAGVSGYGTADEILFFDLYGRALSPDLVVLAFAVGNDLDDNRRSGFFRWNNGRLEPEPLRPLSASTIAKARAKEFLASHFHLYQWLRDRWHGLRARLGSSRAEELREHRSEALADALPEDWERTRALLDLLLARVARAKAGFLLVAIPMRLQVDDAEWAAFARQAGRPLQRDALQARLAAWARERGVEFLDLLPALRRAHLEAPTYYRIDGHFNARGHEVAAREIFRKLVAADLLRRVPG